MVEGSAPPIRIRYCGSPADPRSQRLSVARFIAHSRSPLHGSTGGRGAGAAALAGGAGRRRTGGRLDGAAVGGGGGVLTPSDLASTALGEGGGAGVVGRSTETAHATGMSLLSERK